MEGVGGAHGWQWIFILEGLATVIIGAASFLFVHDFPDTAKFLNETDTIRALRRLREDQQASYKREQWAYQSLVNAVTDYKTYLGMIIYMGCDMPLYAFSLFLPTIIKDLGYTSTVAQLLTVPVYALAALATIFVGWAADRTGRRGFANLVVAPLGIIGFIILIVAESAKLRYAGCFLGALGIYPCISNTISWMSNNIEGVYKRGITLGIMIGWGNLNGIVSSNIYNTDTDGPRFIPGHSVVLAYMAIFLWGGSLVLYLLLKRENAKRVRGERNHWIEGLTVEEIRNLGDKRPDFFYTL
jgi:MFS family permease